jgi:hypothetical protein
VCGEYGRIVVFSALNTGLESTTTQAKRKMTKNVSRNPKTGSMPMSSVADSHQRPLSRMSRESTL